MNIPTPKRSAILLAAALLLPHIPAAARVADLMPTPKVVTPIKGGSAFRLGRKVSVAMPQEWRANEAMLRFLKETGSEERTDGKASGARITVTRVENIDGAYDYPLEGFDNEAYEISVSSKEVAVKAVSETGFIRAMQTLTQMAEGYDGRPRLEAVSIRDWPAFKVRGLMYDTGRSYISLRELMHEIDLLSRFKVNVIHWHLTENQAWRFEVKAFPQLTADTSMTRHRGRYYTQAECRQLDEFAAKRGVLIIPEIDMPGHSQSFTRAMGHSMQTPEGMAELKVALGELAKTFPRTPYLHIGSDEVSITEPDFLPTMTAEVHRLGRKVIAWNPMQGEEITTSTGIDITQMWGRNSKMVEGLANIESRYTYLNHFDVFADVAGIYLSNIYRRDRGDASVIGEIAAEWNDRHLPTERDIIQQNNIYAGVLATAERAWIGGGRSYIEQGGVGVPVEGDEWHDVFADWERRFLFHKAHSLRNEPIPYIKQTDIVWNVARHAPTNFLAAGPSSAPDTRTACGAGVYINHTWGNNIVPSVYREKPQPVDTAWAWTYIYSPREQDAGALIEFQNISRSEADHAPNAGCWDRKGSRIWLNGEEIAPPVWANSGVLIFSLEEFLFNENFTARPPMPIHLKKGWNKVSILLPYGPVLGIRLNKWMYTFAVTGARGIRYATTPGPAK